jgi:hypothetical protein
LRHFGFPPHTHRERERGTNVLANTHVKCVPPLVSVMYCRWDKVSWSSPIGLTPPLLFRFKGRHRCHLTGVGVHACAGGGGGGREENLASLDDGRRRPARFSRRALLRPDLERSPRKGETEFMVRAGVRPKSNLPKKNV